LSTEIRIFLAVAQQGGETDGWTVRLAARSSCRVAATFDLGTFAATPRKNRRNPPKDKGARQGGVVDRTIKTEFQRANQKRLLSDGSARTIGQRHARAPCRAGLQEIGLPLCRRCFHDPATKPAFCASRPIQRQA
jgi:hypothetical protein